MWEKADRVNVFKIDRFPKRKQIEVMGMNIAYLDENDGTPLVCLPPWPSSSLVYYPMILALKDHFRVIALDQPGWGGYSGPMTLEPTVENYASLAAAFIRKLKLEKYYLLGYSFGGAIVQEVLAQDVPQPEKIVFISTLHSGDEVQQKFGPLLNAGRYAIKARLPKKVIKKFLEKYMLNRHGNIYFQKFGYTPLVLEVVKEDLRCDPYTILKSIFALIDTDCMNSKKRWPEAIVVYADEDPDFIKSESREMAEKIGIEPVLLEQTNHDHFFFDIDKSADIVLNFLKA